MDETGNGREEQTESEEDKKKAVRGRGGFESWRFGSRCRDSPGRNQMRGEERERGVEEKNREMGVERRENGVSSTAVIRIHFMEMVSRLRKPTSSLVPSLMIL